LTVHGSSSNYNQLLFIAHIDDLQIAMIYEPSTMN